MKDPRERFVTSDLSDFFLVDENGQPVEGLFDTNITTAKDVKAPLSQECNIQSKVMNIVHRVLHN